MHKPASYIALFIAIIALASLLARPAGHDITPAKQETAFEQVMRTRTIRCGYAMWNPILFKDMKTGELQGISHDIMEEVGKKLDLHIEWAEEAGWGTIVEGLSTRRYDMICNALGVVAARGRAIEFSTPIFYTPSYLVIRADENRITKNDDVDNPVYTIAVLDGEAFSFMAPKKFSKAQIKSLPQNTDWSLIFQEIETKKADTTGVTYADFITYDKANPGKLRILDKSTPTQVYAASFGLPQGDVAFKTMIDAALAELTFDGTIDRALRAYASAPDEFLSPIKPYMISAQ